VTTLHVVTTEEASRVISLRLGDELLARLERKAMDDAMSRNALIVFALGEWLAAREILLAVTSGEAKPIEPSRPKESLPVASVEGSVLSSRSAVLGDRRTRVKTDAVGGDKGQVTISEEVVIPKLEEDTIEMRLRRTLGPFVPLRAEIKEPEERVVEKPRGEHPARCGCNDCMFAKKYGKMKKKEG